MKLQKGVDSLQPQQRTFCLELLASENFDAVHAAKVAKYKFPAQAAYRLLKIAAIQAFIAREIKSRELRTKLKTADVTEYLRVALFFNPLEYFSLSEEGHWICPDPKKLPPEVGRLIDGIEIETRFAGPGVEIGKCYKVKLISKAVVLPLAMKHLGMLVERKQIDGEVKVAFNFADLVAKPEQVIDTFAQRIEEVVEPPTYSVDELAQEGEESTDDDT